MKYLIVVDMQKDFIDGALGTKEAQAIVPNVRKKIEEFDGEVIFTRDTHHKDYLSTQEGRNLPVEHCIEGTAGWEIDKSLQPFCKGLVVNKLTFGSMALAEEIWERGDAQEITLVGLCTDICVISNAMLLKAAMPEVPIIVDRACCAGVTPQSHENALEAMKMCQITIV